MSCGPLIPLTLGVPLAQAWNTSSGSRSDLVTTGCDPSGTATVAFPFWFSYVAPASERVRFTATGGGVGGVFRILFQFHALRAGCAAVESWSCCPASYIPTSPITYEFVLQINVTAGETYIIFAAGDPFTFAAPSAADTQLLTVTATSLGARTDGAMTCATAEPLTLGTSGTFYPGLDNGWSDPSDPCSSCEVTDGTCLADGTLVGKEYRQGSRWWYYDAPLSGTLTVTVSAGPAFAQTLSVWTGPCGSLTEVACLIDQDPAVSFSVTAGTRYYLHLAGYACPAAPDLPLPLPTEPWLYDITLALAFPCGAQPNSTCATAVTLTGPRAAALQGLGTTDDPSTPCPSCAADRVSTRPVGSPGSRPRSASSRCKPASRSPTPCSRCGPDRARRW